MIGMKKMEEIVEDSIKRLKCLSVVEVSERVDEQEVE